MPPAPVGVQSPLSWILGVGLGGGAQLVVRGLHMTPHLNTLRPRTRTPKKLIHGCSGAYLCFILGAVYGWQFCWAL